MNQKRRSSIPAVALSFLLALSLVFGAQPAWATQEEDQTSLSDEEIAAAIENGEVQAAEDSALTARAATGLSAVQGNVMKAFSGVTRYDTAAMQAKYGWSSSEYAIIAGSEGWPDALAASSLAGALECPILLTPATHLDPYTAQALSDLGVTTVLVVGGTPTVSDAVLQEIEDEGLSVERLSGDTRADTQLAIYEYGASRHIWKSDLLFVASGREFADALSASATAYKTCAPVFLTDSNGSLTQAQEQALRTGYEGSDNLFKHALILGGTDRVSSYTQGYLRALTLASSGSSHSVERLEGANRYETSAVVSKWAVSNGYLAFNDVAFTTGMNPADALGGGVLQGRQGSVLLLVDDERCFYATDILSANQSSITKVKVFGSKASVSGAVRMDIADHTNFIFYADIPGLKVYIDAGHGWNSSNNGVLDWGASGSGQTEWGLTEDLANRVGDELRNQYGMEVYVNNKGGWYKLRQAEAQNMGCDLLVSLHFNASGGGATGTESFIHSYNANWKSAALQSKVHPQLVKAMGLADRGKKQAELAVCGGKLPAVLLEICFIDTQSDVNRFFDRRTQVAQGIAAGIAS